MQLIIGPRSNRLSKAPALPGSIRYEYRSHRSSSAVCKLPAYRESLFVTLGSAKRHEVQYLPQCTVLTRCRCLHHDSDSGEWCPQQDDLEPNTCAMVRLEALALTHDLGLRNH